MPGWLFLILSVITIAGCESAAAPQPVKVRRGYKFEVQDPGGWTKGEALDFNISRNESIAEMKDGRLTVNGKDYGLIEDGATILVEASGRVLVNGNEVKPQ